MKTLCTVLVLVPALLACEGAVDTSPGTPPDPNPPTGPPGGEPPTEACLGPTSGAPVPLRRITAPEIDAAIFDVIGVQASVEVSDETIIGYRSNATTSVDRATAQAILLGVSEFSEAIAGRLVGICNDTCDDWIFDNYVPRLFRGAITPEDRAVYQAVFDEGVMEAGPAAGTRWLIEAILQSPRFLYLLETTAEDGRLDGRSMAARMASSLWASVPDQALLDAAASGALDTEEGLRAEAVRMMDDDKFVRGVSNFVEQWMELEELEDEIARPDFYSLPVEQREALLHEPAAFLAAHVRDGATLLEVLTSSRTAHDPLLDEFYGAESVGNDGVFRDLDPNSRAGLVTLPAIQTALAHSDITSPSRRGQIVLAKLLCAPTPPPPAGVSPTLPEVREDATLRERLEAHFSDPSCAGCHSKMDGIGFAFEGYDELGRSRTHDSHGNEVITQSDFNIDGHELSVANAVELMGELGGRWDVSACFATHWIRFATGINENDDSQCLVEELGLAGRADGGVREMILTYVTSNWFRRPRTEGGE